MQTGESVSSPQLVRCEQECMERCEEYGHDNEAYNACVSECMTTCSSARDVPLTKTAA